MSACFIANTVSEHGNSEAYITQQSYLTAKYMNANRNDTQCSRWYAAGALGELYHREEGREYDLRASYIGNAGYSKQYIYKYNNTELHTEDV